MSQRATRSNADIDAMRGRSIRRGIPPFLKDGSEAQEKRAQTFCGLARQIYTGNDTGG